MSILYKKIDNTLYYWETWKTENTDQSIIHYGEVGNEGKTEVVSSKNIFFPKAKILKIKKQLNGYKEIDIDNYEILFIEYKVDGFGDSHDLKKKTFLTR